MYQPRYDPEEGGWRGEMTVPSEEKKNLKISRLGRDRDRGLLRNETNRAKTGGENTTVLGRGHVVSRPTKSP